MQKLLLTSLRTTCGNQRHVCSKLCQISQHSENSAGSHGHRVRKNLKVLGIFTLLLLAKYCYNFVLITTNLPALGVNYKKKK